MNSIEKIIQQSVEASISAVAQLRQPGAVRFIQSVGSLLAERFDQGNKVIIAGNGGSLSDSTHFAEELTGFFRKPRRALPAIALSDPSHITCTANDLDFASIFSRGVEAYGKPGDVFIGLTTSGNSVNIVKAVEVAKANEMTTVTLLGKSGGVLKGKADYELIISGFETSDRIQEAHMAAMHIMIEVVESLLFDEAYNASCAVSN